MKIPNIPTVLLLLVVAGTSFAFGGWAAIALVLVVFVIGLVPVALLAQTVCSDRALGHGSTAFQVTAMLVANVMQSGFAGGPRDVAFLGATARETQLLERLRRSPAYTLLSNTVSILGPLPVFPGYLTVSALGR